MEDKELESLHKKLEKYEQKLSQMVKDWSATRAGSRYGDEYLDSQIKVYQSMIVALKESIVARRKRSRK